ncbi:hypothetical protein BpHYR1_042091 [Brachionus plicatilis]|uniref:Uncharacterized protein n=1 Tax=Brachionus plicatilis TaxID=10195 RepID=A0A3M7R8V0_BRAPC|nr:hypothetical protein BpHYR1_042091 [Brachionus plicatilis]
MSYLYISSNKIVFTVFPRSVLQPQNPKHNFDAGNKHHLAHVKTFLTYTACVKVVFRVLTHVEKKYEIIKIKYRVEITMRIKKNKSLPDLFTTPALSKFT